MIQNVLQKIFAKQDLTEEEAYRLIVAIYNKELKDEQIASFQKAMLKKGPTLIEITSIAKAMKDLCVKIAPNVEKELIDTCGTGGGLSTFNISTAVSILAAAAGLPIAKHGSRSITGLSGTADVLEALGFEIHHSPRGVEKLIENVGFAFLYAPLFHPAMDQVFPMERDLGIRTIFYTMIGPLINPKATKHMMGVYKPELLESVPQLAASLGYTRALFVHGEDGLDEVSLLGKTTVKELNHGIITSYDITPEEFGLSRCKLSDIATGTPEANAVMIRDVFSGKDKGPRRQAVVLNAAGVLMIGDLVASWKEGINLANEIISSGDAQNKLDEVIEASHEYKHVK